MEHQAWAISVLDKIQEKYPGIVERNRGKIPYTAVNGHFDDLSDKDICWWTNGFYSGILWQLYHVTGQTIYREAAEELEDKLDAVLMNYAGRLNIRFGQRLRITAHGKSSVKGMLKKHC